MAVGLAIGAVGLLVLTQVRCQSQDWASSWAQTVVYSLGLAPLFTLTNDLIIGAAPPERAGAASAISETGAELGALSIAILGTIGTAVYRSQVDDGIPAAVPAEGVEAARDTLGGAVAASDELAAGLAAQVLEAAREAFTQGFQVVAVVSAVVAVLSALGVAVFLRDVRGPSGQTEDIPVASTVAEPQ